MKNIFFLHSQILSVELFFALWAFAVGHMDEVRVSRQLVHDHRFSTNRTLGLFVLPIVGSLHMSSENGHLFVTKRTFRAFITMQGLM